METHLSIFRPYERDAKHEDQLTRAALIVMNLIPLAHEAFLRLAGCPPLSTLPQPRFDMQTGNLIPLSAESEDINEITELVSVFLAPHDNLAVAEPNLASERKARYDGIIQYGPQLLVIIESKLYANADDLQSREINTGGLRAQTATRPVIRWQDLLDQWSNLLDLNILGHAERGVLDDFFTNAEAHFADLLPYTDLKRCRDHPGRQVRRLRSILEEATGTAAEVRDTFGHAGVKFEKHQAVAFDRASLYIRNNDVILSAWPAELAPQYTRVYSDRTRVENLIALTDNPDWHIAPNFHLSYWRASPPRRWYPGRHLPGPTYLRQWVNDFHDHKAGRRPSQDLTDPDFRTWLVERGYATTDELTSLDQWTANLPMDHFDIRPSTQITRTWPLPHAVARDTAGQFVNDVRTAISELLAALNEPPLQAG